MTTHTSPRPGGRGFALHNTVPATHIPGLTNPRVTLCQEYAMRQGFPDGYDALARVTVKPTISLDCSPGTGHRRLPNRNINTTFRAVEVWLGTDDAIRAVVSCAWLSRSDFTSNVAVQCAECLEVARS